MAGVGIGTTDRCRVQRLVVARTLVVFRDRCNVASVIKVEKVYKVVPASVEAFFIRNLGTLADKSNLPDDLDLKQNDCDR